MVLIKFDNPNQCIITFNASNKVFTILFLISYRKQFWNFKKMFIYFIAVSVKEKSIKITKICSHCFLREIYIKAAKSVSFNFEGVYCTCKIS